MCKPPHALGPTIKRINDYMAKEANRHLKAHNLTLAQNRLLMTLYRQAEYTATLKELEGLFHVSQPTVVCLASLEDIHTLEEKLTAPLSPEERAAFADMLTRIAASMH